MSERKSITVMGARVIALNLERDEAEGGRPVVKGGRFDLMGSHGMAIAKQSLNGYDGIKYAPSAHVVGIINQLYEAVRQDVNTQLGLEA